jgi:DNA-binding IclR family transcriptional regulator
MLARLPAAQIRALFPHADAFALRTGTGPRSPSALRSVLVDVRRRGHALEDGDVTPGFASIASAVLDHSGHPVAGVAVTFPDHLLPVAARERVAQQVVRTAATITRRIGGRVEL